MGLLASLWGVAILTPLVAMLTPWLDAPDYDLPRWMGWVGAATFVVALWLLRRSSPKVCRGRKRIVRLRSLDVRRNIRGNY